MRKFKALLLMLFVIQCVFAQERTISGTVYDEDRIPVAGVTVKVKGMNQQTSTDGTGYFTIAVPKGGRVLVFSSIGYVEQEQNIQGNTRVSFSMLAYAAGLGEVVVIGLGCVR